MTRLAVGGLRILFGLLAAAAILLTALAAAPIVVPNFFGYFTIQSNTIGAVVLVVTGVLTLRGARSHPVWELARASAATYLAVVGVVYNTVLVGLDGGVMLPWANTVLHAVMPIVLVLDWLVVADRRPLPWIALPVVLVYPAVWLVVVLIRGATDGWVPYPFLAPSLGYPVVVLNCLIVAVVLLAFAALAWWASRLRLLLPA